jgi:ATP-dependent DNA helicase DinG
MRFLVAQLKSASLSGSARMPGSELEEWDFTSATGMLKHAGGFNDLTLLIAGATDFARQVTIAASWLGDPGSIVYAEDAAYLFDYPLNTSLDSLDALADVMQQRLGEIADDLLTQFVELVSGAGQHSRLGWLQAELTRRFHALNMPESGEVDMKQLHPRRGSANAVAKQHVDPGVLAKLFTARRALEGAFEEYEDRPQQKEMAHAVERALEQKRVAVIEAGTGVGKSLAYLIPLAIHSAQTGELCLISTNTINLQQQLMELDIPRLRRILDMLDIRVTLLKGREHYVCLKRTEELWLRNSAQARTKRADLLGGGLPGVLFMLKVLLRTADRHDGDMDSVDSAPGLWQAERQKLTASCDCRYQTCLGDRCEYRGQCHFFARRDESLRSNIVITNHALVFALSRSEGDNDNLVSKSSVIVFDEAHNLESAITNQQTLEVTSDRPIDLANRLLQLAQDPKVNNRIHFSSVGSDFQETLERVQFGEKTLPTWVKTLAEVRGQVESLLRQALERGALQLSESNQLTPATAEGQQRKVLEILGKLAQRFAPILQRMANLAAEMQVLLCTEQCDAFCDDPQVQMDIQSLSLDLNECLYALQNWKPEEAGVITWFNCKLEGDSQWEFKTAPLEIGPQFQALAATKESVILTSATLTVANSFDFLKQSLGFTEDISQRADWVKLTSPFDYQEQALMLVATDMDNPTGSSRAAYLDQLEEVVHGVADIFSGGVLVLFNSYRDLNHVADRLGAAGYSERLLIQGYSGSRGEIAEKFRRDGDRILLATRSFWEGFDVAGEALQCVVLAKLPFANFKDPIHAGRQRALDESGGDSFSSYSVPLAAMQLKQGFGRLIRRASDHGCVFLLDSRVAKARYGQTFIASLPGPRLFTGSAADCLKEANEFMKMAKREAVMTSG